MPENTTASKTKILFIEYAQGFGGSIVSLSDSLRGMKHIEPYVLVMQQHEALPKLYSNYNLIYRKTFFNYLMKQKYSDLLGKVIRINLVKKLFLIPFAILEIIETQLLVHFIANLIRKEGVKLVYSNNGYNESAVVAAKQCALPCTLHFRGYRTTPYPFELESYSYPSRYFAISDFVGKYLKRSGVPEDLVYTVHNSVDVARFNNAYLNRNSFRESLHLENEVLAIGVFGRITQWKGQKDFIDAINIIQTKTKVNFKAFLVGDCSDEDEQYYASLQEESSLLIDNNKLQFCGYQRDVENYYTAMDIVVHTSNVAEPFGRVIIEGMAAGAVVLGMNEGGPAEVIEDGVDGLLIEPRSCEALVNALIRVCEDKALRISLREKAKIKVLENYTPQSIGGKIEHELLKVIDTFE